MTLTELQTNLLSLTPEEKAEAIDFLNNSLTKNGSASPRKSVFAAVVLALQAPKSPFGC
jgi:hypothetical protein